MAKNKSSSLERIDSKLTEMMTLLNELVAVSRRTRLTKQAYTPAEVATILSKKAYTVREWCRLKRVHCHKRPIGRGEERDWEISHQELERIQNHGLLPVPQRY